MTLKMNKIKAYALLTLFFSLGLDQASKYWALATAEGMHPQLLAEVFPFFNTVLVWNRGVSFGMLSEHPEWMPLILTGFTSIITLVLLIWLWRAERGLTIFGLALIIGGAIGNIIDRVRYGAVVDFLDFHIAQYHWPAFNIADSSIFIGVVLLVWESIIDARNTPTETKERHEETPAA